jgi:predicted RNA binding protein YcfA (HicA-like mRNA interferase family)
LVRKPRGSQLPRTLSQQTAQALLESQGWVKTRGGKHVVKMESPGQRPITLPHHKGADYGPQLTNAILRQAGLKKADMKADTRRDGDTASGE